ncbi:MAG: hypothetical protein AAF547_02655 [Actinomycetota bacterium]
MAERKQREVPLPVEHLESLRVGDLILTGRKSSYSEITQKVSKSSFGHAAVVIPGRRVLEAANGPFTMHEDDGGVSDLALDAFWDRAARLDDLEVRRPRGLDVDAFGSVARWLLDHAPPSYPTVGAPILGVCCAGARLTDRLPVRARTLVAKTQLRLVADGPDKVQCAEIAYRLYDAAGLEVELVEPLLGPAIDHIRARQPNLLPLARTPRTGDETPRPAGVRQVPTVVKELVVTLRQRVDRSIPRDHAGLILPDDLKRSPTFDRVVAMRRVGPVWDVVD